MNSGRDSVAGTKGLKLGRVTVAIGSFLSAQRVLGRTCRECNSVDCG